MGSDWGLAFLEVQTFVIDCHRGWTGSYREICLIAAIDKVDFYPIII